jgi:hypothetical protein
MSGMALRRLAAAAGIWLVAMAGALAAEPAPWPASSAGSKRWR